MIKNTFDECGRLKQTTSDVNGAYTRYVYPEAQNYIETYSTITDFNNNNQADSGDEVKSISYFDGHGRTRLSISDLPNAPSGANAYSAVLTEYDILGRVKRQTTPTEVNSSFQPAGDDAANMPGRSADGWLWTSQEYDWKGRVTKATNTDGTFKTISYQGCGCAGGEIVTVQDEELEPNKRRTQKNYSDPFGRTYKTQVLNWDGTPYSTTIATFDALDRAIEIKEYEKSENEPNPKFQTTTFAYDGHGRLKQQHRPEQFVVSGSNTVQTYTNYEYYADDQIYRVTDGRGAKATSHYNARDLLSWVDYDAPTGSGITVPAPTFFFYDAVGNVTEMADATGNTTYQYDQLSRLTSETREFLDMPGNSYTFNYQYSLSGQLTSMTDPSGRVTAYGFDKIGRAKTVTGSGPSSQPTYISNINYRAWGAKKDVSFGNQVSTSYQYNQNLEISQYNISNVQPFCVHEGNCSTSSAMTWDYQYYNDGNFKSVQNSHDNLYDRLYRYDHDGRLKEAYSGRDAGAYPITYHADPYRQIFTYDVWDNITDKTGKVWSLFQEDHATYTNNRRSGSQHDADGRVTLDTNKHIFNAAGEQIKSESNTTVGDGTTQFPIQPSYEVEQQYDGNGQPSKRVQTTRQNIYQQGTQTIIGIDWRKDTTYYMRSSILGGAAIVELSNFEEDGVPPTQFVYQESYVYADNERIYKSGKYEFGIPNTGSWMKVYPNGSSGQFTMPEERSPLGGEIPLIDPNVGMTYQELRGDQPMFIEGGDPFDLSGGCVLDGMPVPCGMINANAHTECPDGNCGPRVVEMCVPLLGTMYEACGTQLTSPFMAFADGSSGFGYNGLLLPEEDQTVSVSLADFRSMRAEQIMSASAFGPGRGQKGKGETKVKKKRSIVKRKGKPHLIGWGNGKSGGAVKKLSPIEPAKLAATSDEVPCALNETTLRAARKVANALGYNVDDKGRWTVGWKCCDPMERERWSFGNAKRRLKNMGFREFFDPFPEHPSLPFGWTNFEGKIEGRWYHVSLSDPVSWAYPPEKVEMHCENRWLRPSSLAHAGDTIWRYTIGRFFK